MTVEEFKRIAGGILEQTNILYLSWATEPLINPNLSGILTEIKKAGIPCVSMVTNLTVLPKSFEADLPAIHRLHVSIDAADRAVYAAIRQRDCLNNVLENVRAVQAVKKKTGRIYPRIAFNTVLLRMNLGQIEPLIDCAASLGVDELNLSFVSVPQRYNNTSLHQDLIGLSPDFNLKNEVLAPEDPAVIAALSKAIPYAEKKNILITVAGRFSIGRNSTLSRKFDQLAYMLRKGLRFPPRALWNLGLTYITNIGILKKACCSFPFRQIVLTADGLVLPCCVWDDREPLGDTGQSTLQEIWEGDLYASLRKRMVNADLPRLCAECNRVNSKKRHGL